MEQKLIRKGRVARTLLGLVGAGVLLLNNAGCGPGVPRSGNGGVPIPSEPLCVTTDANGISHVRFFLSCAGAESRNCNFLVESSNLFISITQPSPPLFTVPPNTTREFTVILRTSQFGDTDLSAVVLGANSRREPIGRVRVAPGC